MTDTEPTLASVLDGRYSIPSGCKVCRYIPKLGPEDRAALLSALDNPDVPHTHIAAALTRFGYPVSDSGVRRHRKGCHRDEPEGSAEHT